MAIASPRRKRPPIVPPPVINIRARSPSALAGESRKIRRICEYRVIGCGWQTERGCVEDQPQHGPMSMIVENSHVQLRFGMLRLVFDTAALHSCLDFLSACGKLFARGR